ncbi:MAG: hypothetical protein DMF58_17845 [Acidobacteria bacterium]|nr:MAG: hypothetical protein DMF58_17845 [Acidobacteriota bacterium]
MRLRLIAICAIAVFTTSAFAKDVFLSIGGSVGVFHTDTRIFNPSSTKDIQIQAYLLPVGNVDNSGVQPITITVPKRQMVMYNDVVQSLFNSSTPLAAIRLKSDDDFVSTQRIYAQQAANACEGAGTLGQFVPGLDVSTASKGGVLIQLKSSGAFRTNIGVVNPNATAANVTWRLYDKNNNLVATGATGTLGVMPPFSVITPTRITDFFSAGTADLSDAWVGFTSDQPIFAYASVVDNVTTDPTFIPMSADSGAPAITPQGKVYNVTLQSYSISVSPSIGPSDLKTGDKVTFHITVKDTMHGFQLNDPNGAALVPGVIFNPGDVVDKTFTITSEGSYNFFCVNTSCGNAAQHAQMVGQFVVGTPSDGGYPHY